MLHTFGSRHASISRIPSCCCRLFVYDDLTFRNDVTSSYALSWFSFHLARGWAYSIHVPHAINSSNPIQCKQVRFHSSWSKPRRSAKSSWCTTTSPVRVNTAHACPSLHACIHALMKEEDEPSKQARSCLCLVVVVESTKENAATQTQTAQKNAKSCKK